MKQKESFSNKFFDLLTFDPEDDDTSDKNTKLKKGESMPIKAEAPVPQPASAPIMPNIQASANETFISSGMVFVGDLKSDDDLRVLGEIKGNVETGGSVRCGGKITGDVKGVNFSFTGSTIQGNITASGIVTLDKDTSILGNITAKSIECNGKIQGDISVETKAYFMSSTAYTGKLTCGAICIDEGAAISATIEVKDGLNV